MIVILGGNGSMGTRYQAILDYLKKPYQWIDVDTPASLANELKRVASGFIIATPTNTHADQVLGLLKYKKPILCEKPITKDLTQLKSLFDEIKASKAQFRMVYQYSLMVDPNRVGRSVYNYFKHGSDGLTWDCLQIVSLARGYLALCGKSPIWTCVINGKPLSIADMDAAYVAYIQKWLSDPSQDLGLLYAMHEKTDALVKSGAYE